MTGANRGYGYVADHLPELAIGVAAAATAVAVWDSIPTMTVFAGIGWESGLSRLPLMRVPLEIGPTGAVWLTVSG